MKIECEVHELVSLQRTTEVENLRQHLESTNSQLSYYTQELSRVRQERNSLEDRLADHQGGGASMQQVSDMFKVYLTTPRMPDGSVGGKIGAIKKVREIFQCGLREAKFIVEGDLENERTSRY